jgi:hypothetical protein
MIRIGLFVLALAGIILPFKIAHLLLFEWYPPQVTGMPVPLSASIPAYLAATAIAIAVVAVCYALVKRDKEPSDKKDGLDNPEDLPY